eukprot:TRINITY_DN21326_c0_g1_i1.p1 TRINITY_DN21326_c0_g1~~TRINITY_DN21326_c0_g1_i1.p1  ORF type:complete len:115 (+),score=25.42 TRINITY_DN21326_c0_g1_i1:97-441(+)
MSKIALVTGGNKGLGFGIVKRLAAVQDVHVVVGSRDENRGNEAVKELNTLGFHNVETVVLDVADVNSIESAVKAILDKHQRIDILVNNAGYMAEFAVSFLESDLNEIQNVFKKS